MERKKLSDILAAGQQDSIASAWEQAEAAGEFEALPRGEYTAHIIGGELFSTKNNTPGYKITFEVADGDHAGRRLWHDLYLTPAAMPMTKRDLAKLGIAGLAQLEVPVPPRIRCRLQVALRTDDNGNSFNRISRFEVIAIDPPEANPFPPTEAILQAVQSVPPAATEGDDAWT